MADILTMSSSGDEFDPDQSSLMSVCIDREEGQEIINHGYGRSIKEHVARAVNLGEIMPKVLSC